MSSKNPALPVDYIPDYCWEQIYFGDDSAQTAAIESILKDISASHGNIYIVTGAVRTGKSTILEQVMERARNEIRHINAVNPKLELLSEDAIRNTGAMHNIICLTTDIRVDEIEQEIKNANDLLKRHPNSSILIDALIDKPPIEGIRNPTRQRELQRQERMLEKIMCDYPHVKIVRTKHNPGHVKEALWELNAGLAEKYSGTGDAIGKLLIHDVMHPDVKPVITALNENNRDKYDLAFGRIEAMLARSRPR